MSGAYETAKEELLALSTKLVNEVDPNGQQLRKFIKKALLINTFLEDGMPAVYEELHAAGVDPAKFEDIGKEVSAFVLGTTDEGPSSAQDEEEPAGKAGNGPVKFDMEAFARDLEIMYFNFVLDFDPHGTELQRIRYRAIHKYYGEFFSFTEEELPKLVEFYHQGLSCYSEYLTMGTYIAHPDANEIAARHSVGLVLETRFGTTEADFEWRKEVMDGYVVRRFVQLSNVIGG